MHMHKFTVALICGKPSPKLFCGRSTRQAISAEHFSNSFAAANILRNLCSCLEQHLHSRGVVSRSAMPAMFGAVDGPAQGGEFKVRLRQLQRWIVAQYL